MWKAGTHSTSLPLQPILSVQEDREEKVQDASVKFPSAESPPAGTLKKLLPQARFIVQGRVRYRDLTQSHSQSTARRYSSVFQTKSVPMQPLEMNWTAWSNKVSSRKYLA